MKKSKLLMPILGVTATLGAVVPTIVACNKGEEETGYGVKVNFASIETTGFQTEPVTKTLPKAYIGKAYVAVIEWKCFYDEESPIPNTYCSVLSVENSHGQPIEHRMIRGINKVVVMIPPAWVQADMEITITPADSASQEIVTLDTEASKISAYDEAGEHAEVAGIAMDAPFADLETTDNVITFTIKLEKLDDYYKRYYNKSLVGCSDLVFYMTDSQGRRVAPFDIGNVYLGDKQLDAQFSGYNALHIYFQGGLTKDGLKEEIYGYYDFTLSLETDLNLNGGNCYAFDRRALGYEPVNP